jgi:site-specific DNA recombinase
MFGKHIHNFINFITLKLSAMDQTKSVGIWIRVSTEDQAQGDSPEHHEKRANLYAEANEWHVVETYHLESVSGKAVMQHPEAKRMMKDIKEGRISGLIFSKLARLTRNLRELLEFAEFFRNNGADLISISEKIDTTSPAGRLFYTMIAAIAEWEREEISSRVAASVPIRAKMGKQIGGYATLGYKWVDKKLQIDENEAPIRKLVYELFLKHRRQKMVARLLNEMGHRTKTGKLFTDSAVKLLICNSTAKGVHLANYVTYRNKGGAAEKKPESEWVFTECPAIVSAELWDECNRIIDSQKRKPRQQGKKTVHLLAGYVYCTCGKKMYVFHKDMQFACRPCRKRILSSDLEEIYLEQLKEFLLTEVDPNVYLQKSESYISEKETLLASITEESGKLRRKMVELVNMRMNNELSRESFKEHHSPLEEQLRQLTDQMPKLEADISFLRVQADSADVVLQDAKMLYQRWPTMTLDERRTIVETITESIVIEEEEITIKLAYMPAALKNSGNRQTLL